MSLNGQYIIPAAKNERQYELFLESSYEYGVYLDTNIAHLKPISLQAKEHGKKILIHTDLIQGLKNDEYSTEYICQEMNPFGIISTKPNVIAKAKQRGLMTVQRVFLLDSQALEKSYSIIKKTQADYIEILPGILPDFIKTIAKDISVPILTGGLITKKEEVACALDAGAEAITTSAVSLWKNLENTSLKREGNPAR
ncbi:glycerol-3-phosphate responsive antiterminator [Bacillus sp. REN3]|uniref:glycerol-3-phosphate responsive antiterminator n=1 Tax=Bacillus sp. REN3 TaxID=2802440 RepID=UPI001AED795C|nr:glycerol-3-phosphate responsive antiterminator [Bacillus sp. REN3]